MSQARREERARGPLVETQVIHLHRRPYESNSGMRRPAIKRLFQNLTAILKGHDGQISTALGMIAADGPGAKREPPPKVRSLQTAERP